VQDHLESQGWQYKDYAKQFDFRYRICKGRVWGGAGILLWFLAGLGVGIWRIDTVDCYGCFDIIGATISTLVLADGGILLQYLRF